MEKLNHKEKVLDFFLNYVQENPYFTVRSVVTQYISQFIFPKQTGLSNEDYILLGMKAELAKTIGQCLSTLSRGGYYNKNGNGSQKIDPLMIEGLELFIKGLPIARKRDNPKKTKNKQEFEFRITISGIEHEFHDEILKFIREGGQGISLDRDNERKRITLFVTEPLYDEVDKYFSKSGFFKMIIKWYIEEELGLLEIEPYFLSRSCLFRTALIAWLINEKKNGGGTND